MKQAVKARKSENASVRKPVKSSARASVSDSSEEEARVVSSDSDSAEEASSGSGSDSSSSDDKAPKTKLANGSSSKSKALNENNSKSRKGRGGPNGLADPDDSHSDSADSSSESDTASEKPKRAENGSNKAAKKSFRSQKSDTSSLASDTDSDIRSGKQQPNQHSKVNGSKPLADSSDKSSDAGDSSDASSASDAESDREAMHLDGAVTKDRTANGETSDGPSPKKRKNVETEQPMTKKFKGNDVNGGQEKGRNLFIGSLSWNIDEAWLRDEFSSFGNITGCRIMTHADSGRSKGFGYLDYSSETEAAAAQEAMNGAMIDNRNIKVDFATPRPDFQARSAQRANKFGDNQSSPSDTLFVGNLAFSTTPDVVEEAFSTYGMIKRVALPTDPETGALKGFGYVAYGSIDEAKAAMDAMTGSMIAGRPIRLDFASPRQDRDPSRGSGGFGDRGRGGFRGGRGDARGRGGRGGPRGGGRGGKPFSTNHAGFGDFSGSKVKF